MLKNFLLVLLPLLVLLSGVGSVAQAQICFATPNSGADFQVYEPGGREPLQVLCVGKTVRLKDASGRRLNPAQVYYQKGATIVCSGFTDTTTFYTPTTPGQVVITQNTQNPQPGQSGLIFARTYEVKAAPQPTFTVAVCTPGLVQVIITDTNYDQYTVQIGSGTPVSAVRNTPATYPAANPATVTVTGRYTGAACVAASTQNFTPKSAPQVPILQRLTVQGSSLEAQFAALSAEYQYSLQVADAAATGGYRTVAAVPVGTTSFTLPNAPLPGCYRLLLQDICQPASVALPSQSVCTLALAVTSGNGRNQLSWVTSQPGSFSISRNGSVLAQLPPGTTQYQDTAVVCGTSYSYRVAAATGGTISVSNEAGATTVSNVAPPAPRLLASFNLRNQVELTAQVPRAPTGGQLSYARNSSPIGSSSTRTFRDSLSTPTPSVAQCYTAQFLDACGNRSATSTPVCPVVLTATATNEEGTNIQLNWTAFQSGATSTLSYRVISLSASNAVLSSTAVSSGLTFFDTSPPQNQQVVRYRIEATGPGLNAPTYSNVATVARQVKLFVPTAFSPNGDGLNDVLELKGRYLDNFRFTIIDRNGQQVFQSTSRTQSWDGRIGTASPVPGTYAWRYESTDQAGRRVVQHGSVTIVR